MMPESNHPRCGDQRKSDFAKKQKSRKPQKTAETAKPEETTENADDAAFKRNQVLPEEWHSTREGCKYFGKMVQMNASSAYWFGDQKTHLHAAIDDSTRRLVGVYFDREETLF